MKQFAKDGASAVVSSSQKKVTQYPFDNLDRRGATDLAKRLEDYWHVRGYRDARFWAEPIEERFEKIGTHEIYRVSCNLVNGLPLSY